MSKLFRIPLRIFNLKFHPNRNFFKIEFTTKSQTTTQQQATKMTKSEIAKDKTMGFVEKILAIKEIIGAMAPNLEDLEKDIAEALLNEKGELDLAVERLLKQDQSFKNSKTPKRKTEEFVDKDREFALALELQDKLNETGTKSKGPSRERAVIPLEHDVILLKNWLGDDQQMGIVQQSLELSESWDQFNGQSNVNTWHHVMSYNWNNNGVRPTNVSEPKDMFQFARDTFKDVIKVARESGMDEEQYSKSFNPNALSSILYPKGGSLYSHQDGVQGCVMGLSVGESVIFHFALTNDEKDRHKVQLDSGDIIIFSGGKLYHGIDKVLEGTAPKFWYDMKERKGMARFNLQFRDPTQFYKHQAAPQVMSPRKKYRK